MPNSPNSPPCEECGDTAVQQMFTLNKFQHWLCVQCGSIWPSRLPSSDEEPESEVENTAQSPGTAHHCTSGGTAE